MVTRRRRYRWAQIAALARENEGRYVLHPDLAHITLDTLHHMRRRVPALRSTDTHEYGFARGHEARDDLGVVRFDCYIRLAPKGSHP